MRRVTGLGAALVLVIGMLYTGWWAVSGRFSSPRWSTEPATIQCVEVADAQSTSVTVRVLFGGGSDQQVRVVAQDSTSIRLRATERFRSDAVYTNSLRITSVTVKLSAPYAGRTVYDGSRALGECTGSPPGATG